jgi:hypothetical protein
MRARDYWRAVTVDRSDMVERLVVLLREHQIPFCVIGGQGVNAYVEPVVSLDLDLVIAAPALAELLPTLEQMFTVETFPHSVNLSAPDSDVRVQIQVDPRYQLFLARAADHQVLGERLPVAAMEDVLLGKVWAALDSQRRPSKRQKDLADIARLLERDPSLRARVPAQILDRLL